MVLNHGVENRGVEDTDDPRLYPDHSERFDGRCQVLGKESLGGRSYWELELGGNGALDISVSYKSIGRQGDHLISEAVGTSQGVNASVLLLCSQVEKAEDLTLWNICSAGDISGSFSFSLIDLLKARLILFIPKNPLLLLQLLSAKIILMFLLS
ncbi:hypothetical protein DNTS_014553 [Danionella cerebrum]|uniref:SPRY-associated domain-containing protein n=1 Tax=Danionella cerebrum TaxID=2873325 RepID=A0A553MPY0_9TELE|nr:hypothetical protein DNTS_014553 [Danionella translucida]